MMGTKKALRFIVGLLLVTVFSSCAGNEPILVGMSVELTGNRGDIGVMVRNGAQLAVDQINKSGGIDGRRIEFIVKDDKGDPETARQVDMELIEQGVVAIIGHVTSSQTAAVFDLINQEQVVLFSPSSTSSQFSGKADYFFRATSSTDQLAKAQTFHLIERDVRNLACIYDLRNSAFTEPLWFSVKEQFESAGGKTVGVFTFRSGESDLKALMFEVKANEPETILFITSAVDTALLIQYGKMLDLEAELYSSTWANSGELLTKGGQAVEGLELVSIWYPENPAPDYRKFRADFEEKFGESPGLFASHAYESVLVLAQALEMTGGDAEGLPEALISIKDIEGVGGRFSMDAYGDVERPIYITKVVDGVFEMVDIVSPDDLK